MPSTRQPVGVATTVALTPTVKRPQTRKAGGVWKVTPGCIGVVTPVGTSRR